MLSFLIKYIFVFMSLASVTSCGLIDLGDKSIARNIAASTIEKLVSIEESSFHDEIFQKLFSLHCYYLIAQKNLIRLDNKIPTHEASLLYNESEYLSLLAAKGEIDGVESELAQVFYELSKSNKAQLRLKKKILLNVINLFEQNGSLQKQSLINLKTKIGMDLGTNEVDISDKEIQNEIMTFDKNSEFHIYEKNIEHLSHMMEMNLRSQAKKWEPSENENGLISGEEFPPKVWALTFSLGPREKISLEIIELIKRRQMKSTFFLAAEQVRPLNNIKQYQSPLIELAVQSMTNINLTKVGELVLQREITEAKKLVESKWGKSIKFYRLPLGAGQRDLPVRDLIAKNNLISVLWNVDTMDWIPQTPQRIVARTKEMMKKTKNESGIILFHDIYPRTILAANDIMLHLNKGPRKNCHLREIVDEINSNGQTTCK